jgi:sugar/nucleoside kinase (ribokinase family)
MQRENSRQSTNRVESHSDTPLSKEDPSTKYDICGIGNPLVDILVYIDEDFLHTHGLNKGIMHLIDWKRRERLLELIREKNIIMEAGGSCPNTLAALGLLGLRVALMGKIGDDDLGRVFEEKITAKHVNSFLQKCKEKTGTSIILITPDKERTMNTHLSACREYSDDDLPLEVIDNSRFFYFTGYMWDTETQKAAVEKAIQRAKERGLQIIFDAADPFAVERYREDFLSLISHSVDIVVANAQEAQIFTGENIEKCVKKLGTHTRISVVKNGAENTHIFSDGMHIKVPSFHTDVRDTTGAGDAFSAGFIYGLIKGHSLRTCGKIASFVASKTIEKIGAQAPDDIHQLLKEMLKTHTDF